MPSTARLWFRFPMLLKSERGGKREGEQKVGRRRREREKERKRER